MVDEYNFPENTGITKNKIRKFGARLHPSKMAVRAILLYAGCMQQVKTSTAKFVLNMN